MIRAAVPADSYAVWELMQEAHNLTPYRDVPLSEEKGKMIIARCIGAPTQFAWVVEKDGRVEGVLLGAVDEMLWSRKKEAHDILFYVRPAARGAGHQLARAFIAWARTTPARLIGMSVSFGAAGERTETLLEHLGLQRIGGIFIAVNEPSNTPQINPTSST